MRQTRRSLALGLPLFLFLEPCTTTLTSLSLLFYILCNMHETAFECQRHRVGEESIAILREATSAAPRREFLTRSIDRPYREEESSSNPCPSNLRSVKLRIRNSILQSRPSRLCPSRESGEPAQFIISGKKLNDPFSLMKRILCRSKN